MRHFNSFLAIKIIGLIFLLAGCVSFTIKDTQDGIVLAKATLTGVNNSIANLVTNKQISVEKAQVLAKQADEAEKNLTISQDLLKAGKPEDALSTLRLANSLLLKLQRELEKKP